MRFLLLFVALAAALPMYAFDDDDGNPPPPPRVVRITGETASCETRPIVYQVEVANTDRLTLDVVGGTISPTSAPQFGICGGVPDPAQPSSTRLIYTPVNGNCAFAISARIAWNSSGFRRLTVTVQEGNTTRTSTRTFTGRTPTVSGPPSPLCVSGFGGDSQFFSSTGPPGASIQWSTVLGPSLTFSSPSSANTNASGFLPDRTYNVRVVYTCPGQNPVARTLSLTTLALNDPACNLFECPEPGDIFCREVARRERLEEDTYDDFSPGSYGGKSTSRGKDNVGSSEPVSTSSFSQVSLPRAITVFPNPVRSYETLTINLGETITAETPETMVRLIDVSGKELYRTQARQPLIRIPMAEVPAGTYFVQTIREGEVETTKVIVNPQRP